MKLKSFSILEMLISIVISGLVISTAYSVFYFTQQQFYIFQTSKATLRNHFELTQVLTRGFEKSNKVTQVNANTIALEFNAQTVTYVFKESLILRNTHQHTDTFYFELSDVVIEGIEATNLVTDLSLTLGKEAPTPFSFHKEYGAILYVNQQP